MESIFPPSTAPCATATKSEREALVASYEALRGAVHKPLSWSPVEDSITLTYAPTGAGFTGRAGMAAFLASNPFHPLHAEYVSRFNNQCTRLSCVVDVEQGVVSESMMVRTLFDAKWAPWMLAVHAAAAGVKVPAASVTMHVALTARIAQGKLLSVVMDWDQGALLAQLGVRPAADWIEYVPRVNSRLLHPNRSNAVNIEGAESASSTVASKQLHMGDLLTDLPPPTPKLGQVRVNPAMVSNAGSLLVGVSSSASGPSTPVRQPAAKVFLTDGSAEKPRPFAASGVISANPMGTMLDAPVKVVPSRALNDKIQTDIYGTHEESKPSLVQDDGRFKSSVFSSEDDVPAQSIRFSAALNKSASMQRGNIDRFASSICSPDELAQLEARIKPNAADVEGNVLFGQSTPLKSRLPATNAGQYKHTISQINFDYMQ